MTESKKQTNDVLSRTLAELGPVVGSLAIVAMLFPAIGGFALLGFAGQVRDAIEEQGAQGPILYAIGFALFTGFALLPTYALAGVAGFTFGGTLGSTVSLSGIVGGAIIGYVIAATIARKRVMRVIEQNPKAKIIRDALVDRSPLHRLIAVTLIRLPPNSPFALTNFVMSSVHVNIFAYTVGTAAGIAPRTILACMLGTGVAEAGAAISDATKTGGNTKLYLIGASLLVVAVIYVLFARWSKEALKKYLHDETPDDTMPVDT
ncbi:TVP38/TMEM64 family protein [Planctomycetaceae bacterium AH-315-I19]|nr:TVP38/TMEM64 family protein [Planctomycetaceae bacterium AH-315-I19]